MCTLKLHSFRAQLTAPQDAHKRLALQVAEWLTASLYISVFEDMKKKKHVNANSSPFNCNVQLLLASK